MLNSPICVSLIEILFYSQKIIIIIIQCLKLICTLEQKN